MFFGCPWKFPAAISLVSKRIQQKQSGRNTDCTEIIAVLQRRISALAHEDGGLCEMQIRGTDITQEAEDLVQKVQSGSGDNVIET